MVFGLFWCLFGCFWWFPEFLRENVCELAFFWGVSGVFGAVSGVFLVGFSVWNLGGLGGMGNIVF